MRESVPGQWVLLRKRPHELRYVSIFIIIIFIIKTHYYSKTQRTQTKTKHAALVRLSWRFDFANTSSGQRSETCN
jgi:hypothetical protein